MSVERKIKERTQRRVLRVRSKLGDHCPRISVFQSLQHMYAQIIDDSKHATLVSLSSQQVSVEGDKKATAFAVGRELAKKAIQQGIKQVVFDRGERRYHGRVKALAEGLREGGLEF